MWQKLKNQYHLLTAFFANIWYGFPSRKIRVIGITGTSGKTTTTHMVYEILKAAGYRVSLLSTIKAVIAGEEFDTGFHVTTPDPQKLPYYIDQAVKHRNDYFVLEVSSHALDQNRVAFIDFTIGILTSLAHEHLDYHKTFANYAKAKFTLLHRAQKAVLPAIGIADDIKRAVRFDSLAGKATTFGVFVGNQTQQKWKLQLAVPGDFYLLDGLAAATATELLGVSEEIIRKALHDFSGIPGRFEEIPNKRGFRTIIDFAHKPDALESVLQTARTINKSGRVIVVFGSASERDVLKRSIMGEISAKLADITVLTDEDSRYEDPMKIINEIAHGCEQAGAKEAFLDKSLQVFSSHVFVKIPDRREAINYVINTAAKKGDIVLFCGKGHEQSMSYKGVEKPWNEHETIRQALKKQS